MKAKTDGTGVLEQMHSKQITSLGRSLRHATDHHMPSKRSRHNHAEGVEQTQKLTRRAKRLLKKQLAETTHSAASHVMNFNSEDVASIGNFAICTVSHHLEGIYVGFQTPARIHVVVFWRS